MFCLMGVFILCLASNYRLNFSSLSKKILPVGDAWKKPAIIFQNLFLCAWRKSTFPYFIMFLKSQWMRSQTDTNLSRDYHGSQSDWATLNIPLICSNNCVPLKLRWFLRTVRQIVYLNMLKQHVIVVFRWLLQVRVARRIYRDDVQNWFYLCLACLLNLQFKWRWLIAFDCTNASGYCCGNTGNWSGRCKPMPQFCSVKF